MATDAGQTAEHPVKSRLQSLLRIVAVVGVVGLLTLVAYLVGLWLFVFGALRQGVTCIPIAALLAVLFVLPW
jgi:hypothetical protein